MYKSINRIRKLLYDHRDTHIKWVTYLKTHPYAERTAEENRVGGLMHQLQCLRDYNGAIKDLENIEIFSWMFCLWISVAMIKLGLNFWWVILIWIGCFIIGLFEHIKMRKKEEKK